MSSASEAINAAIKAAAKATNCTKVLCVSQPQQDFVRPQDHPDLEIEALDTEQAASLLKDTEAKYAAIVSNVNLAAAARFTHDGMLSLVNKALVANGKYIHYEGFASAEGDGSRSARSREDVELELLMAGLTVDKQSGGPNTIVSGKPGYDVTQTSELPTAAKSKNDSKKVWASLVQEDVNNTDDDLEDEDNLLDENEQLQSASNAAGGCETKPRACANCTCGRAAEEAKAEQRKMTKEELLQQSSSCGKCYKGDAFRCASCPFKGQPAFKPGMGEQVLLDLSMDDTSGPVLTE
eukprot:gb/GECG01000988.1/.p1 GENE.gb/GECG01000988.1/~~gb/GECG01000988.1/.p1  ORF type:complete len:294 (+),score=58.78 gb/GECG01000988.1/:1-882(+)